MADTKGKYAVDIEDGQEEEEGIPQWAIFAGIGGLLLVIIIIIIVVVAGGDDEAAPTISVADQALLDAGKATNLAVGQALDAGGLQVTVTDPKAAMPAGYSPTKDTQGVQQVQSTTVMELSMSAANVATAETKMAASAKADYASSTGIDEALVTVSVKGTKMARRSLSESAESRVLAAATYSFVTMYAAYIPVTMEKTIDLGEFMKQVSVKAALEVRKVVPLTITKISPPIVEKVGEPLKPKTGAADADFATILEAAKAVITKTASAIVKAVETVSELVKAGGTLDVAAIKEKTAAEVKKVDFKDVFTEDMKKAAGGALEFDATKKTEVEVKKEDAKTPEKPKPSGNATNSTPSASSRRVRRGLAEASSAYYSQLVDRLVV